MLQERLTPELFRPKRGGESVRGALRSKTDEFTRQLEEESTITYILSVSLDANLNRSFAQELYGIVKQLVFSNDAQKRSMLFSTLQNRLKFYRPDLEIEGNGALIESPLRPNS